MVASSTRGHSNIMRSLKYLISGALVLALFVATAQANTVPSAEAKKFYSLRQKLRTLSSDVKQSMQQIVGNNSAFYCLTIINTETQFAEAVEGHVGELITLAGVMRDKDDEFIVLHELRIMIPVGIGVLTAARQTINKTMSTCADVATANVKGQAILGVFSEMADALRSMAILVGKDPN